MPSSQRAPRPVVQAAALHIGLNRVDPNHYAGWAGDLQACEADAHAMARIAGTRGMASALLLTRDATRARVLAAIRKAATRLRKGDFFLLTYSGHGGQVPDLSGDEGDNYDETWCLYDGQLIDDELYLELGRFRAGVRILVLSDSCHSGSVVKATEPADGRSKSMPAMVGQRTYAAHRSFYDRLQRAIAAAAARRQGRRVLEPLPVQFASTRRQRIAARFDATVILLSGCQDNQTSLDGEAHGAFTGALLSVWANGRFTGHYRRFHQEIVQRLPSSQTPNLFTLGPAGPFLAEEPFAVRARRGARITPQSAARFVERAALPAPRRRPGGTRALRVAARGPGDDPFEAGRTEAAVVGSSVISFVTGVTPERREAIVHSSLFAQLHASRQVPDPLKIYDWYEKYFEVLGNIGWVVQDRGFAEYIRKGKSFETHKAILDIATTLLGPGATALKVVTTTLDALRKMDESTPWIALFNRESQHARTARFQVGLAEQDAGGDFFVNLMAFGLKADAKVTQVLVFKARSSTIKLKHFSGRVTINTAILDSVRADLAARLAGQAADYVRRLPALA